VLQVHIGIQTGFQTTASEYHGQTRSELLRELNTMFRDRVLLSWSSSVLTSLTIVINQRTDKNEGPESILTLGEEFVCVQWVTPKAQDTGISVQKYLQTQWEWELQDYRKGKERGGTWEG
jgi:hypothetical protein